MRLANAIKTGLALALFTGVAQAATFSFASDSNPNGPVIAGALADAANGLISDAGLNDPDGSVGLTLLYDADGDGPGSASSFAVRASFTGALRNYSLVPVGSRFLHTYVADGQFDFIGANDAVVLRIFFGNAIFSSWSNSQSQWGASATLEGNAPTNTTIYSSPSGIIPNLPGTSLGSFAFGFSNVRTVQGGSRVGLFNGNVTSSWIADASFTGEVVPSPGSAALAALGLAAWGVRRRRPA